MSNSQVLTARWIFPVHHPPLQHGTIAVNGDRIIDVAPAGARSADIDLGNAAIIPGLVNTHTHLDLSGMRGQVPPSSNFTGWLRKVIEHRRSQTPAQTELDISTGLNECVRYGTTLLGDIASEGRSWSALVKAQIDSVVFYELIGLSEGRASAQLALIEAWLRDRSDQHHCRPGLSPHAPFSVHRSIFQKRFKSACPLAIHIAESAAECALLEKHEGPFVDFLKELNIWDPQALSPDFASIARDYGTPTLFVHGNYLNPRLPIPANATIVYCPRTHHAFGHRSHPMPEFLKAGVRVVLATDSLASNPDLDVLAEARFVHERFPSIPADVVLRMITLSGAEALGFEKDTGSLQTGKYADLAVVPLPDRESTDPYDLLFSCESMARRSMWHGIWR